MLNVVLRLRRDNEFNYNKIKDTFIPANGEICLVDTARDGLRAVCGDGVSTFSKLEYMNELIVFGYYKENNFYRDYDCTELITASKIKIYIDLENSGLYFYTGEEYKVVEAKIPTATETRPGAVKLYTTVGQNVDGTMTQKAITDELEDKVEITLKEEDELVIFF